MKKRIFVLITLILMIFGSMSLYSAEEETQTVEFPDITVYDWDGNAVRLSDFRGKPVVLNFWASWCVPCKQGHPNFNELYKKLGDEVNFVMVNMTDGVRETEETAKTYFEGSGYSFPVYFDSAQNAAYTLGISSIPLTFFIDEKGHGIVYASGTLSEEIIQYGIDLAKGEKQ